MTGHSRTGADIKLSNGVCRPARYCSKQNMTGHNRTEADTTASTGADGTALDGSKQNMTGHNRTRADITPSNGVDSTALTASSLESEMRDKRPPYAVSKFKLSRTRLRIEIEMFGLTVPFFTKRASRAGTGQDSTEADRIRTEPVLTQQDSNETNRTITSYTDIKDLVDPAVLSAYNVLLRYFPVILAVFSLIGNGLLFAVLSRPNNRHTTTSIYLMALAIADLAVTARNFAFWLDLVCGVTVDCGLQAFLYQSSMSISSWLLAVISFERVLSVAVPLKVKFICKPLRAKILIALVVILLCAYGAIYGIFFTKKKVISSERYMCIVPEEVSSFYTYYFRWISQCLHSIFPLCIIFFNSVIIVTLLSRRMSSSTATRSGRGVTINIVLINTAFVVTRFPSNFLYLYQALTQDVTTYVEKLNYALILECSYQLRDLNSVLNFYIYFLAGQKFRQDTKLLLSRIICCRNKGNNSETKPSRQTRLRTPKTNWT